MVARNGRVVKRTYKPKGKAPLTKTQAQAVVKLARKTTMRAAETKSLIQNNQSINMFDGVFRVHNLNTQLAQGSTAEQIIGEKLFLKNFNIRMRFSAGTTNSHTKVCRVLCIATKERLNTGTGPSTLSSQLSVFRNAAGSYVSNFQVDLHKVDLLYDKTFTLTPAYSGQVVAKPLQINLKIDRTKYYDSDASGFFKDKNYYLLYASYDGGGNVTAFADYDWTMNFKDE